MAFPAAHTRFQPAGLVVAGCGGVVFAYVAALAMMFANHAWIMDAKGGPLVTDFLEVWVAGLSVLAGHPAAPYDWRLHHAAQVAAAGHPFPGFLGWHYPPPFLFVAGALAALPYAQAFVVWICGTGTLYAAAIWKIAQRYEAALIALAMPAALGNAMVGQNGFLTAALIGAALLTLETKPRLSGMFMGLLTYKPQFGVLLPLVLLVDRNGRAFASAALTTIVLIALSWLAFGTEPFVAFFRYLPATATAILGHGTAGFAKLQSMYGLARWLGAGEAAAWLAHGVATLAAACGIVWIWRRDVPFALKAAAVAAATLIATPYLYMYDFPLLALPFAFLFRASALDRLEIGVVIATACIMLVFGWVAAPIGPLLAFFVAALIVRRALPAPAGEVALQAA
jgi:arabinofuranan 3-O-arabinosyltransferase